MKLIRKRKELRENLNVMINSLLKRVRNEETSNVCEQIIRLYKGSPLVEDPHLVKIFSELEPMSHELLLAVKRIKQESTLEELDEIRDDKARALFGFVQGHLFNPDAAIQQAAQKLNKVLQNYSLDVIRADYASESAQISSLLTDLSVTELAPSITAVAGMAELITALTVAEENFLSTSVAYEKTKSEEAEYANATTLKNKVVVLLNTKLVAFLNGMLGVDEETYGELARAIGQVIADRNVIVRKRKSGDDEQDTEE